jgi:hypothetical protein
MQNGPTPDKPTQRATPSRIVAGPPLRRPADVRTACLAVLVMTACNDSTALRPAPPPAPSTPQGAAASACASVHAEDLARAIGSKVTRREDRSPNRCVFYTDDPLVYVDLEVDRHNAGEAWKGVRAGNTLIGAKEEGLAGLGEQAFFGPRERLYVLRGETFLAIEAGFDANVRDRARRVAELVLKKIP